MSDSLLHLLTQALLNIYARAGREVTYLTDAGERRPYWANRYLQALKRAIREGTLEALVTFIDDLVTREEPSRGFFYLKEADRLDLSVEALVLDESQPFHDLFSEEAVEASRSRLNEHGYELDGSVEGAVAPEGDHDVRSSASTPLELDLKLTVGTDGLVTLRIVQ
jgi:hypothetical protein